MEYAHKLKAEADRVKDDLLDRDARLFREAAHHRGLEGPDQRPRARQQLPHQRRRAPGAQAAVGDQRDRPARRHRVPRHDHAAVHRRPDRLGRDRRAHHREPGAPRARLRPVVPGGLQERHRRQPAHRRRRDQGRAGAAPLPVGDQGRPLGDRVHPRQRGLPRHPARRQGAQLRRRQRRRRLPRARRGRACATRSWSTSPTATAASSTACRSRWRGTSPPSSPRATTASWA